MPVTQMRDLPAPRPTRRGRKAVAVFKAGEEKAYDNILLGLMSAKATQDVAVRKPLRLRWYDSCGGCGLQ